MIGESREHHTFFDAVANWIKKYRQAIGLQNELANCTPEEVAAMAHDVGLSPGELRFLTAKGSHAADELPKLLRALGFDPQKLASKNPAVMHDLQRICVTCSHKKQCRHELARGTAAGNYIDYCPNAISIDALFSEKTRKI